MFPRCCLLLLSAIISPAQGAVDEAWQLPVMTVQGLASSVHADEVLDNQQQHSLELADLLRQASGTQTRSSGGLGAYSEVSLRGNAARQVQVLFDGIPLELAGGQAINLALFPTTTVAQAEIYQGAAPLNLLGGAAGAVNLLPPSVDHPQTRIDTRYGSFATLRTAARQSGRLGLISLGHESSDNDFPIINPYKPFDPTDPQRRRPEPRRHADVDQQFGLWSKDFDSALGDFHTLLYGFQQQQMLPDRVNSPRPQTALDSDLILFGSRLEPAANRELRFNLQQHRQHYRDPGSRIGLAQQDLRMHSRRIEVSGYTVNAITSQIRLSWQDYQQHDRLSPATNARAERWRVGADFESPLTQHLLIRLGSDYLQESSSDQTGNRQTSWLLQPALLWQHRLQPRCRLQAELAQRERLAGFVERFGDRGYLKGNPQLRNERLIALDLGLACRDQQNAFSTQVFAQDLSDAITVVYDAQGVGRAQNSAKARIWGLQSDVHAQWGEHLSGRASATYLHSKDRSAVRGARGQQLPGRARWQGYAQLRLKPSPTSPWAWLQEFEFASGLYYDSSNLRKAPATRLHHSSLQFSRQQWRVRLQARNWLDQKHAQFNGFPQPGRQFHLSLSYLFDYGESS